MESTQPSFENIVLLRYGEIHLKGLNRPFFEHALERQIQYALHSIKHTIDRENGRIYVRGFADADLNEVIKRLSRVFGLHSISPAVAVEKKWDSIVAAAKVVMRRELDAAHKKTFKVFSKRADKRFPMTSDVICQELGHELLEEFGDEVSVDVHHPEIEFGVEIREQALLYTGEIRCAGGLPIGTSGKTMLLLSGGIDSPVAGYCMARRGVELSAIHFFSYPYTSERAKDKVIDLAKILAEYVGIMKVYVVPFTEIQLAIHENCPEKETTLLMRRLMMKISERIAVADGAKALITGESLGQVASQTLESLCATNDAVSMPVFRPLISMDKIEIMDIARKIGTYDTSILPFEDCCTVFVPKHPVTKPDVSRIRESEAQFDFSAMIDTAVNNAEIITVKRS